MTKNQKLKFEKILMQLKFPLSLFCLGLAFVSALILISQTWAIGPQLTASLNPSSPSGMTVQGVNTLIAEFNLTAANGNITFDGPAGAGVGAGNSLTINLENGCAWPIVSTSLTLKDKLSNTLDVISEVNLCQAGAYTFDFSNNDLYIFSGQTEQVYLYADTTKLGSNYTIRAVLKDDNVANVDWSFNYDGGHFQTANTSFSGDIYANTLVFGGSAQIVRPVVSLAPGSPSSGLYVPGVKTLLAAFNISALGDNLSFENLAGNTLTVDIASACDGAGSIGTLYLEDPTHAQLDTVSANLCVPGSYTFDFSDTNMFVPVTTSKTVYIYGDTSSGNVSGVYAWLNDDDPNNIGWSVASDSSNYHLADFIFTPPIYGNVLLDGGSLSESVNPTAVFSAPTKSSSGTITDTTVELRDNWAISSLNVDFSNSTANVSSINCTQTSLNIVNCDLAVTSSGDLIVYAEDSFGNSVQVVEPGYVITPPSSSGARNEVLAQPTPICTLVIAENQNQTIQANVNLKLDSTTSVAEMIFSNNLDFVGSAWQPYNQVSSWDLNIQTSGQKTVYAMVKDAAGRMSEVCSDAIEYQPSASLEQQPSQEPVDNLLPVPVEPLISDIKPGAIFRTSTSPTLYFMGSDYKRHPFPNETVYLSWFSDYSLVEVLASDKVSAIQLGKNVTIRPGTWLIKIQSDPKVYALEQNSTLRWITTESLAQDLYGSDWKYQVKDVDPSLFVDYEVGADITSQKHPAGTLIQYQGQSEIYYLDQNSYKALVQPDIFTAQYYQDKFVIKDFKQSIDYPGNAILVAGPLSALINFE